MNFAALRLCEQLFHAKSQSRKPKLFRNILALSFREQQKIIQTPYIKSYFKQLKRTVRNSIFAVLFKDITVR